MEADVPAGAAAPNRLPELVAPAGEPAALRAALAAGADGVYLGLRHLSARAHARNFGLAELREAVRDAHAVGAKIYVTLNTMIRDEELEVAAGLLHGAAAAGADAVVFQDLAVLALAADVAPGLPLHASTQLAVCSTDGLRALHDAGVRRVVVARELSAEDVATLHRQVPGVELETFVHGALCYGASGLCLMSALQTGRSGNRGRCGQPCRRPFSASSGEVVGQVFSLHDLWGLPHLPALRDAGVCALKIEGRLRSPAYVSAVVRTYRQALDALAEGASPLEPSDSAAAGPRAVRSLFSRHTGGGYLGGPDAADRAGVDPWFQGHRGYPVGRVLGPDAGRLRVAATDRFGVGDRVLVDRGDPRPYNLEIAALWRDGEAVQRAHPGDEVALEAPPGRATPGSTLFLVSAPDVKRACAPPPPPARDDIVVPVDAVVEDAALVLAATHRGGTLRERYPLPPDPRIAPLVETAFRAVLAEAEDPRHRLEPRTVEGDTHALRVPPKAIRRVRRDFLRRWVLADDVAAFPCPSAARPVIAAARAARPAGDDVHWTVRVDRPSHLDEAVLRFASLVQLEARGGDADAWIPGAAAALAATGTPVELALPAVLHDRDRPALVATLASAAQAGVTRFQLATVGSRPLVPAAATRVSSDASLLCGNPLTAWWLRRRWAVGHVTLPLEADRALLTRLAPSLAGVADVVVYTVPTLMVGSTPPAARARWGESAPLPDGAVLRDEQGRGVRLVTDPHGRTVVLAALPFSLTGDLAALREMGYRRFRVDLRGVELTRGARRDVLDAAAAGAALPDTFRGCFDAGLR